MVGGISFGRSWAARMEWSAESRPDRTGPSVVRATGPRVPCRDAESGRHLRPPRPRQRQEAQPGRILRRDETDARGRRRQATGGFLDAPKRSIRRPEIPLRQGSRQFPAGSLRAIRTIRATAAIRPKTRPLILSTRIATVAGLRRAAALRNARRGHHDLAGRCLAPAPIALVAFSPAGAPHLALTGAPFPLHCPREIVDTLCRSLWRKRRETP